MQLCGLDLTPIDSSFVNKDYKTEDNYRGSNQDSDVENYKDNKSRYRGDMKRQRNKRKAGHHQLGFSHGTW